MFELSFGETWTDEHAGIDNITVSSGLCSEHGTLCHTVIVSSVGCGPMSTILRVFQFALDVKAPLIKRA